LKLLQPTHNTFIFKGKETTFNDFEFNSKSHVHYFNDHISGDLLACQFLQNIITRISQDNANLNQGCPILQHKNDIHFELSSSVYEALVLNNQHKGIVMSFPSGVS